jgi:hypothetical protein
MCICTFFDPNKNYTLDVFFQSGGVNVFLGSFIRVADDIVEFVLEEKGCSFSLPFVPSSNFSHQFSVC